MKQTLPWLAVAALVLAGCAGKPGTDPDDETPPPTRIDPAALVPEGSVRFVAIGDIGQGMTSAQPQVALGIQKVCERDGCQFVIVNGDNIYPDGVRSAYDPQFEEKFEKPYVNLTIPFYLSLGNHDNGNGAGSNPGMGNYQVDYHYRADRTSNKWNLPARFYTFTYGNAQFFALDSGPQEVSQSFAWEPESMGPKLEAWLAQEMAKSTAQWKFAFAHHPYISNSIHGDAGRYDNIAGRGLPYRTMIEEHLCGKIHIFFAGHDHNLQWLKTTQSCGGLPAPLNAGTFPTEHIVSGAGGASIYRKGPEPHNEVFYENYQDHGFAWFDITGNKLTGIFYDKTGEKELFKRTLTL